VNSIARVEACVACVFTSHGSQGGRGKRLCYKDVKHISEVLCVRLKRLCYKDVKSIIRT
jgi:hypothetical protein